VGKFLDKMGLTYYYSKINTIVQEIYAKIGEEKQNIIQQIVPVTNNLYAMNGFAEGAQNMASGDDLNNYTDVGRYEANPNSLAATLLNCPTSVSFSMDIKRINSTQYFYMITDYNGDVYVRRNHIYSDANHFTDWLCLTKGQDITITKNTSYIANDSLKAVYSSGILSVYGYFKISGAVPGSTRLFTFSNVKLKEHNYYFLIGADNSIKGKLEVTGDGVALHSSGGLSSYSGYIYINATFPADHN